MSSDIFERLAKSKFRSSFKLTQKDKIYITQKGLCVIEEHAKNFISKRIAPAFIANDGKQTPTKNHPVFIAQHATATCCRKCIKKWYNFDIGIQLSDIQQKYIVDIIMQWIKEQIKKI